MKDSSHEIALVQDSQRDQQSSDAKLQDAQHPSPTAARRALGRQHHQLIELVNRALHYQALRAKQSSKKANIPNSIGLIFNSRDVISFNV